jgi:hypothetical protein
VTRMLPFAGGGHSIPREQPSRPHQSWRFPARQGHCTGNTLEIGGPREVNRRILPMEGTPITKMIQIIVECAAQICARDFDGSSVNPAFGYAQKSENARAWHIWCNRNSRRTVAA